MNIMIKTIQLLIIILIINPFQSVAQNKEFTWPNGAKAAICLTYDDGLDSQLDIAIPDLENENLKGTFYLTGDFFTPGRIDKWKQAARKGHELGNHSIFHPCSGSHDFVWEEYKSENYTVRRMVRELSVMNNFLYALDGQEVRSYAYTCGETEAGGVSIIDSLVASGLFVGARGLEAVVIKNFRDLNLFNVPSFVADLDIAKDMIPVAEEAKKAGGLAVFTFHGVGGDYLEVSREDHYQLLKYLNQNREYYWTAPFREIVQHIIKEKKRLGWD
jgi:peptidoglycan/xylan/chitin deacetylase (PgdA/CDA1 family)